MPAEIIPFPLPAAIAEPMVEPAVAVFRPVPQPANVHAPSASRDGEDTDNSIVGATLALTASCREMAESLALLIAHCETADGVMAEIGEGANAITGEGAAVGQAVLGLKKA